MKKVIIILVILALGYFAWSWYAGDAQMEDVSTDTQSTQQSSYNQGRVQGGGEIVGELSFNPTRPGGEELVACWVAELGSDFVALAAQGPVEVNAEQSAAFNACVASQQEK
ncbi:MAG: hypothetical protein Q8P93_03505 [bacterium]|nr:hypothetical protein [bacterium]